MTGNTLSKRRLRVFAFALCSGMALKACENLPEALQSGPLEGEEARTEGTLMLEERDVEAPEVFNALDDAIWDGRPSFGGVWVAYPGNTQPERVNIRNMQNGKSVVGALFKRETDIPGPKITVSSDAAEALGIVAGTPTPLSITALRREPVEVVTPGQTGDDGPEVLTETALPPVNGASAAEGEDASDVASDVQEALSATDEAPAEASGGEGVIRQIAGPAATAGTQAAPATPAPAPAPPAKPFIQVATFSSAQNANELVAKLVAGNVPSTVRPFERDGRSLFLVVSGPAATQADATTYLERVKALGFADAFPISN